MRAGVSAQRRQQREGLSTGPPPDPTRGARSRRGGRAAARAGRACRSSRRLVEACSPRVGRARRAGVAGRLGRASASVAVTMSSSCRWALFQRYSSCPAPAAPRQVSSAAVEAEAGLALLDLELAFLDRGRRACCRQWPGGGRSSAWPSRPRSAGSVASAGIRGHRAAAIAPRAARSRGRQRASRGCPVLELVAVVGLGFLVEPALRELVVVEQGGAVHASR